MLLALAILASLLSFAKFSHCEKRDWQSPDNYIHACYTDIAPLYTERKLSEDVWPYSSGEQSVEYPVLMGMAMYATALPVHDIHDFYFLSIFLLALLFIGTVFLLQRINGYGFYFALAPAVIGSLFINWDLWAIPTMLLAIYWFDRKLYDYSAIALSISVATKFFPVVLLIPIIVILIRSEKNPIRYLTIFSGTWLAVNLPFAITTPTGWWHFYKFNIERGADWGSIYNIVQDLGARTGNIAYISALSTLIMIAVLSTTLFSLKSTPTLAETSFIVFAALLIFTKVYSPQYVLWLTALAVIAIKSKQTLITFWVWQLAELIYHVAIWQHLALISNAHFGLNQNFYALFSFLRIVAMVGMVVSLNNQLKQARSTQGKPWDFLFDSASVYP